ncbi:type VI secretion system baseplate subunit TssF [Kosakonia sp. H7A]|uniref:type VI secretion system baseplate subunit TssF n=1 Tax=Kosakonia sp. H7A TaxID=2054598 RepID=UPI0013048357|nr:type VI secretion system baseplate subunit TssF [Kosakonia sp. H7A]
MAGDYFNKELFRLRELARHFGNIYPELAPMLRRKSEDPDVERLLEGVAYLTGLTRQKMDEEFPELINDVSEVLFPHFLRAIPSVTLIHFPVKRGTRASIMLPESTEVISIANEGINCRFRTTTSQLLHPIELEATEFHSSVDGAFSVSLDFILNGNLPLSGTDIINLRICLSGEYEDSAKVFLLFSRYLSNLYLESEDGTRVRLCPETVRFPALNETIFPSERDEYSAFRMVREYFIFPEKFFFIELNELSEVKNFRGSKFRVFAEFTERPNWFSGQGNCSFMINVIPAINLYTVYADPIMNTHREHEYIIVAGSEKNWHPDLYKVVNVTATRAGKEDDVIYHPWYAIPDGKEGSVNGRIFRTIHKPNISGTGWDTFLSLYYTPDEERVTEILSVSALATDGMSTARLRIGDICIPTDYTPDGFRFSNISRVSPPFFPRDSVSLRWTLLSQMTLGFISAATTESLKKILSLHVYHGQAVSIEESNIRRIEGIQSVRSVPRHHIMGYSGVVHGYSIDITCNPSFYEGPGDLYLFGCILDDLFAALSACNTFTQLNLEDLSTGEKYQWPARSGSRILI